MQWLTPFWQTGRDRISSADCRQGDADINANPVKKTCLLVDSARLCLFAFLPGHFLLKTTCVDSFPDRSCSMRNPEFAYGTCARAALRFHTAWVVSCRPLFWELDDIRRRV